MTMTMTMTVTMKRCLAIICFILCYQATQALAEQHLVFDVPPHGGTYEVPVLPGKVAVLYFPSKVTGFIHGQDWGVKVQVMGQIAVLEIEDKVPAFAMSAQCQEFIVAISIKPVTDPAAAAMQVQFRAQTQQQLIDQRVAEALAVKEVALRQALEAERAAERARLLAEQNKLDSMRAQIKHERTNLDQVIGQHARKLVAAAINRRHETKHFKAIVRSSEHVIIRITQLIWLGDDVYVPVEIENRGDRNYRIAHIELRDSKHRYPFIAVIPTEGHKKILGLARGDSTVHGVIVIPNAVDIRTGKLELIFTQVDNHSTLDTRIPLHD